MSETITETAAIIPEGFDEGGYAPFSKHIGPLSYKKAKDNNGNVQGSAGLVMTETHIGGNNRGHGGLMLTLLDEAMGMTAALQKDGGHPVVTVSMQTNFIAGTVPGEFIHATGTIVETTATMAFVDGKAWCGDTLVGSASGVWKYLRKRSTKE
ncbi:hypothetical protein A9Q99_25790 [Gammaproteobacteria bacterium 45_16_T64]|nr:hypothetical protein A9Q99_25790 [Gammaproteobacteria bacterium 45_16_T64]